MQVYIELVILDNFALIFLLARLSYYLICELPNKPRMISACTLGTTVAVFYPFLNGILVPAILKIVTGLFLSLILFKPKKLLKGMLFFFILTFTYGGTLFALGLFIHGNAEAALTKPVASVPVGIALLTAYILFVDLKKAIFKIRKSRDINGFIYDAEIRVCGSAVECKAFLDSGNRLYDDKSGLPVVIASAGTLAKALGDDQMSNLLLGKTSGFAGAHYVEYLTVGGKSKLFVFRPDELVVYVEDKKNIISDVMLGVAFKRLSDVESYGLILNPAVLTGE
ncbi:MAG: sigma-E processing peptidase SpoIIGA [Clostridia bacterium]|nr:sigma-E processing peptidase SpoIIGA [Clostridia bacterium]